MDEEIKIKLRDQLRLEFARNNCNFGEVMEFAEVFIVKTIFLELPPDLRQKALKMVLIDIQEMFDEEQKGGRAAGR